MDQEIAKMLAKGIVEVATHTTGEVMSNIFIRSKKDGSHRLILNLKDLNQFVSYHHFKMDMLHSILKLIERGCFMVSLDLKTHTIQYLSITLIAKTFCILFGKEFYINLHVSQTSSQIAHGHLLEMQQALAYIFQTLTYMEYCISN
jgi:hypothetical protein